MYEEASNMAVEQHPVKDGEKHTMKHIDEFTIHAFRGLRDVKLEKLGQINLLVGDNNSGKTSVLEALFLFHDPLARWTWRDVISSREIDASDVGRDKQLIWLFPYGEDRNGAGSSITPPK